jgi:hypothetical protein
MKRYRIFEVRYMGPTNFKGSHIKIVDLWRGESKTLSYDHSFNRIEEQAQAFLESIGFTILADSADQIKGTHMLMVDNFALSIRG